MFKLTVLGIEVGNPKCEKESVSYSKRDKMAKTKQQKRFGKASNYCHSKTNSNKSFGKCMKKELKK